MIITNIFVEIFLFFVNVFCYSLFLFNLLITNIRKLFGYKHHKKHNIKYVSFSGAGWHMFYHIGAIRALNEYLPDLSKTAYVAGASAGAFAGTYYLTCLPIDKLYDKLSKVAKEQRSLDRYLDRLKCKETFNSVFSELINYVNEDCKKRLIISTTKFGKCFIPQNIIKYNFRDNNHLEKSLIRSGYIPFMMGNKLFACDKYYFDGSITNDLPEYTSEYVNNIKGKTYDNNLELPNKSNTLKISVRPCDLYGDISPQKFFDSSYIFMPPSDEFCEKLYMTGYNDTKDFLKHYLVKD
jgi:Patatin-like phospholipase